MGSSRRFSSNPFKSPMSSRLEEMSGLLQTLANTTTGHPIERGTGERAKEADHVITLAEYDGSVLLGTSGGVVEEGTGVKVGTVSDPVNSILSRGNETYVGTTRGLYRLSGGRTRKVFPGVGDLNVKDVVWAGSHLWLSTPVGAFRFDDDVDIAVKLPRRLFFEGGRILEAVRYEREGDRLFRPYGSAVDSRPEAVVRFSDDALSDALEKNAYSPIEDLRLPASFGFKTLHIAVRDTFGNTVFPEPIKVLVVTYDYGAHTARHFLMVGAIVFLVLDGSSLSVGNEHRHDSASPCRWIPYRSAYTFGISDLSEISAFWLSHELED